jgi:hypothetical protein
MAISFSAIQTIAEERIRQAMDDGEFDDLPGTGRPLDLDDDAHLPPDMRLAYRILKNSGYMPQDVAQRKEVDTIKGMLQTCRDEQTSYRQVQKLNYLVTKLNEERRVPVRLEEEQAYYSKVVSRVEVSQGRKKSSG